MGVEKWQTSMHDASNIVLSPETEKDESEEKKQTDVSLSNVSWNHTNRHGEVTGRESETTFGRKNRRTFKSNIIAYYKHRTRHIGSLHGDTNALQQHTCTQQQMEKGEGAIEKKPHRIKNPTM